MKCAVISANYGNFDPVRAAVRQSVETDFILFSDSDVNVAGTGWKNYVLPYPRAELCPRMRAKYVKLQHHRIPELKQYNVIIWADAALEITSDQYVTKMTQDSKPGLNVFGHPDRNCIYEEYATLIRFFKHKIEGERLTDQVQSYIQEGHPAKFGLVALTHFTHIPTPESTRLLDEWWLENVKWTYRDQISFPVVCRRLAYCPAKISGYPYDLNLVNWHSHP